MPRLEKIMGLLSLAAMAVFAGCAGPASKSSGAGTLAAEANLNPMTPEFLISRGFVSKKGEEANMYGYTLRHVTVREAARRLGFAPEQMQPTAQPPIGSDIRTIKVRDCFFVIESETRDFKTYINSSLDDLDTKCTLSTSLEHTPDGKLLPRRAGSPRLHIKSVTVPAAPAHPLELTLEFTGRYEVPVSITQEQFSIEVRAPDYTNTVHSKDGPKLSIQLGKPVFQGKASFPTNAPRIYTATLPQPRQLALRTSTDQFRPGKAWRDLPRGTYLVRVCVSGNERLFDHHLDRPAHSDDYELVIK